MKITPFIRIQTCCIRVSTSATAGVASVGFRTGTSAFGPLGASRTLLVSHRYFLQFQVVSETDDPSPSVENGAQTLLRGKGPRWLDSLLTASWVVLTHSYVFSKIMMYIPPFAQSRLCVWFVTYGCLTTQISLKMSNEIVTNWLYWTWLLKGPCPTLITWTSHARRALPSGIHN